MTSLLQDYVTRAAQSSPDAIAIVMGRERWSYREVDDFSNSLATCLHTAGCGKDDRVVLFMPKNPRTIASIIGILKAGCVYVPIDVGGPAPRALKIIESADPKIILVDESTRLCAEEIASGRPVLDVSST